MKGQPDEAIWEYARINGLTIVAKDGNFYNRIMFVGAPPKLVWLCLGNCTRDQLVQLILTHEKDIRALETAPESVILLS